MKHFKIGQLVRINPENDNENYDAYRGKDLLISYISKNSSEHPLYDQSMSPDYLYDLEIEENGRLKDVPFLLYDYELIKA